VRTATYIDHPNKSPWIAQLAADGPPQPLHSDATADVAVVGAGIAGIATAFFVLRTSNSSVILVERDRVARGATGRNAGQLTTYSSARCRTSQTSSARSWPATPSVASTMPTTCST
jgi:cation diffusion facilitator CzcD-associated flavoprotein CzcO